MVVRRERTQFEEQVFLAGERVPAGVYVRVDGDGREIEIDDDDILPASLDGRVACYRLVTNTWRQVSMMLQAA